MQLTPNLHAFIWTSPNANNCNTFLMRSTEKNILIDPGHVAHFEHVRQGLLQIGVVMDDIDLIICTHAHPDHMEAVGLFDREKTLLTLHHEEWQLVKAMAGHIKSALDRMTPDFFLTEGELNIGDVELDVYHTPGHSPGGTTLYWTREKALFTGDLIFGGGLGRTDLPGGNGSLLKDSIRRMAKLDSEWMLSGHGEVVAGADAVKNNFEQVEKMWFDYI